MEGCGIILEKGTARYLHAQIRGKFMLSETLCREIGLQPEVTEIVLAGYQELLQNDFFEQNQNKETIRLLGSRATWDKGLALLKECLAPDERGFGMLAVMLDYMCGTKEDYQKKGIPDEVFRATMGCFPRFIGEHKVSYGVYGFDRAFWTPRQLSMQLFRIGELEYEFDEQDGKQIISIHIPSDAVMTKERCRDSYERAQEFIGKFYPEWSDKVYGCNSWLLAPGLKLVLPETSNIIRFQSGFNIIKVDEDSKEFLEWVYKRNDIPYEELPEDTSLQRNMKKYLLRGGKIGEADGMLKKDAWR